MFVLLITNFRIYELSANVKLRCFLTSGGLTSTANPTFTSRTALIKLKGLLKMWLKLGIFNLPVSYAKLFQLSIFPVCDNTSRTHRVFSPSWHHDVNTSMTSPARNVYHHHCLLFSCHVRFTTRVIHYWFFASACLKHVNADNLQTPINNKWFIRQFVFHHTV